MWGALLAVTVRSSWFQPARLLRAAWLSLSIGAPLALLAAILHLGWIVYSLSAFASIAFVYLALFSPQRWLQRLVTHPFLVYTGVISYGLYLLHKFAFDMAKSLPLDQYAVLALPAMLGVCYALATASWVLYERPLLELKRFFVSSAPARAVRTDQVAVAR